MKVGVIMGSVSDYEVMADAVAMLGQFGVDFEKRVVSAHRTPDLLCEYAKTAKSRGIGVIIAGAGGAAHLPGMVASMTTLPVVGVPVKSRALNGLDSLLSIVQMPAGVPVATTAINGAQNAALIAVSILALQDAELAARLEAFRAKQTADVLAAELYSGRGGGYGRDGENDRYHRRRSAGADDRRAGAPARGAHAVPRPCARRPRVRAERRAHRGGV